MTRIAIADDDPLTRSLVAHALRGQDVELCEASSGAELVQLLAEEGPFDLVITDLSMPWMSGCQVIVAARGAGIATPFIVITALSEATLPKEVERLGHTVFLRKPIGVTVLRERVAALLGGGDRALSGTR